MSDTIVAPETRDLDELAIALSGWLVGRLPEAREVCVTNLAYPRGAGQSHETILFDAAWQDHSGRQEMGCVLRIKPGRFTVFPDNLFEEQFAVMRAMHQGGKVRVAEPLWLEMDSALLGRPFFVMRKVSGRVPVSVPPYAREGWVKDATTAQRRTMWQAGVRQLAEIQNTPLEDLAFLAGPAHARDGLAQEWDKYLRFVAWLGADGVPGEFVKLLEAALARLDSGRPAYQPPGLVWGDARLGNMMFGEDFGVIAVMDWEQPSLGGALHDLAWFLEICDTMHGPNSVHGAPLDGMGSRDETVALWHEVCGKSADDLEWYLDFTRLKMSCLNLRMDLLRGTRTADPARMAKRLKV